MTNQDVIDVVHAFIDGKIIQSRLKYVTDQWETVLNPSWDFSMLEYRVKPAKWWIEFSSQGIPTGNWTGIEPVNGNYRLIEVTE